MERSGRGGRKGVELERGNWLTGGKEWKERGGRGERARGTDWISRSDSPAGRWAKIQKFRWCRLNLATITGIQPSIHYIIYVSSYYIMAIHTLANRERVNAQRHVTVYFLSHSPKKGLETKISNAVEIVDSWI